MVDALPLSSRFALSTEITAVQAMFFERHGYLVFDRVAQPDEVASILSEVDRIQAEWIAEGRTHVHGIPLFVGKDPDGEPFIQRFTFTSMFSPYLREFVLQSRFEPVRRLVGEDARVGHDEMDGVVFNRYVKAPGSAYPRLGWHTDGLRDLAYLRMPEPMFNIGLHFDRIAPEDGGLRLIPGSHNQGLWDMCFRKFYFFDHTEDESEVMVETWPGDLTVHDGRLWHRVGPSTKDGWQSLRRSMYVPYQRGEAIRRNDDSPTPIYHRIGQVQRWWKRRQASR
ncbi:MAG: phytanoyl-CoA dioxygenase [Deltaproteobacteria bacterium]|nr:phytanoyl-CoA dioxygenase [Deltaproteobacteria bacterium]HCH66858.1 phytanoyl-CoA dioxygenase [Deltaproteobacteria bacterium]